VRYICTDFATAYIDKKHMME